MRYCIFSCASPNSLVVFTLTVVAGIGQCMAQKQQPDELIELKADSLSETTQLVLTAEHRLKQTFDLNYDEDLFVDVMNDLAGKTKLNFILDQTARDDSLCEDDPITIRLTRMPLNKALLLMLQEKNATYFIDDGVVRIISRDVADTPECQRVKMFNCQELLNAMHGRNPNKEADMGSTEEKLKGLVSAMAMSDPDWGAHASQFEIVNGIAIARHDEQSLQKIEAFLNDLSVRVVGEKLAADPIVGG